MPHPRIESAPLSASTDAENARGAKSGALAVAGISAALASACCIGPLVLASIGLGGAAAGVVAVFEPLRPVFTVIAIAALGLAGWKIHRPPLVACGPDAACAPPQPKRIYKTAFWAVAVIALALLTTPYYLPLFF